MKYTQEELEKEFKARQDYSMDIEKVPVIYKLPDGTYTTEDPDPINWWTFWSIIGLGIIIAIFVGV